MSLKRKMFYLWIWELHVLVIKCISESALRAAFKIKAFRSMKSMQISVDFQ